jgi:hypothetical protein
LCVHWQVCEDAEKARTTGFLNVLQYKVPRLAVAQEAHADAVSIGRSRGPGSRGTGAAAFVVFYMVRNTYS